MKKSPIGLLADELDDLKENGPKQLYGVYTGVVQPFPPDVPPMGAFQGRVKVKLSTVDSLEPLYAWARVAVPMAGLAYGTYFIPTPGTEVLVAFENGDIDVPFIIGSLWNGTAPPPVPIPETQIRTIRTPSGNQIVFTEAPPTVTIQSGPTSPIPIPTPPVSTPPGPTTINLSAAGAVTTSPSSIMFVVGTSTITITAAGIFMQSGGSTVNISASGVLIQGAPGKVPSVLINPTG
jgi:phage baseplate assembly protein gpV